MGLGVKECVNQNPRLAHVSPGDLAQLWRSKRQQEKMGKDREKKAKERKAQRKENQREEFRGMIGGTEAAHLAQHIGPAWRCFCTPFAHRTLSGHHWFSNPKNEQNGRFTFD